MKILIVNYEYPPLGGGGGIFSRDLAEELAKDHECDVITSHFKGLERTETINNVNIRRMPVLGRTSLHTATMLSLLSFPFSALALLPSLKNKKYDIIHTHFAVPSGPAGVLFSKFLNIPNVLSLHGGDIYDPSKKTSPHKHAIFRWAVRNVLNKSQVILANSTRTKDLTHQLYAPNKNTIVQPLGIPTPNIQKVARTALGLDEKAFYLTSIGRLIKRKGFDFLINALGLLSEKNINPKLLLLGDGPELGHLEALAREKKVMDNIKFLKWTDEKKYEYLSASDVFVLPSIYEPFGIVLLEAMFCGLPIVSTDLGGPVDLIQNNVNGLLVPVKNPKKLADAILTFLNNPEKRSVMGNNNKKKSVNFSISEISRQHVDIFNKAINAGT